MDAEWDNKKIKSKMKLSHILLAAILSGSVSVLAQNTPQKRTPVQTKNKSSVQPSKPVSKRKNSPKLSVPDSTASKKPLRHIDFCAECGRG